MTTFSDKVDSRGDYVSWLLCHQDVEGFVDGRLMGVIDNSDLELAGPVRCQFETALRGMPTWAKCEFLGDKEGYYEDEEWREWVSDNYPSERHPSETAGERNPRLSGAA